MSSSPPKPRGGMGLFLLVIVGITALVLMLIWSGKNPQIINPPGDIANEQGEGPKGSAKFSPETSLNLVTLRNQAIGDLENHEFAKADAALSEIIRIVPADPFGSRNLAICRQLALEATDKLRAADEYSKQLEQALIAIKEAKAKEPNSYVPWLISARVTAKMEQTEKALDELREAIRLAPGAVGPSYDMFMMLQLVPGDKSQEESYAALKNTYQKEPQNLFVIKDYLPMLAQRKSTEFADAAKQAQSTIAPFVEMIKVHTRIDLNQTIESALQDAADGNWAKTQRSMTILKNLIVSEAARDKRYVLLDSLEYVLTDFSKETTARFDRSTFKSSPPSNPVHFLPPDDLSKWPTVSSEKGLDIAVTDFDLDGEPDLVVFDRKLLAIWSQKADGKAWKSVASVEANGDYSHVLAFDFDDDVDSDIKGLRTPDQSNTPSKSQETPKGTCHAADPDVVLYGPGGLKLLENSKDPATNSRTLVAKAAGAEFDAVRQVFAAVVADFDSDGDLDLAASTESGLKIFSNRGNLTFEETTARSKLPSPGNRVVTMVAVDWDKDTDIDVLLSLPDGAGLLENVRHGQFQYRELPEFTMLKQSSTLRIGDFDGNTSWDVLASGPTGAQVVLTDRTPAGIVHHRKTVSLSSKAIQRSDTGDFDNDSFLDAVLLSDSGIEIFLGDENSLFRPMESFPNEKIKKVSNLSIADLDRDGDLDLNVVDSEWIICLSSQCHETDNPENGWMEIQLVGERIRPGEQNWDRRVNHINLGGSIEVKSGDHFQAQIVSGTVTHFGLGRQRKAELARILWTNGIPSNLMSPSRQEFACIEQKLLGSCPYLYAWNGEKFEFVTDLLWNAPLGLKFAQRVVAPWREWEYLKIEGRQLKAVDREYQLRITAELWEAEYFDQCKLFAIDHPEGTQIFTNEKVGPEELARHKIHTVKTPRLPKAAYDSHGRNVLGQIVERDGMYTKTFDKRLAQGLAEDHYLELDLGEFPQAKSITLFLTGWMFPGSTSLRVQHSQNPDMPAMKPPALWVPNALGEWIEVRPFMGFPGGKTKTIAVDLSDIFQGNDHRLRIVSNLEIFWDAAFFTVDDETVELKETELSLTRADVVDRGGVSFRFWPAMGSGPDQFDYSQLVAGMQWPAMSGKFTRYGDVKPLLTSRDDQLVVIQSGDEIQLAFAEPESELPEGWVRDFVIYTVGWDKDADQNTVYGDAVEPMPFEGMTDYAHRNGEPRPLDDAYLKYLSEYQTRTINPTTFWKKLKQSTGSTQ